MQGEGWVYKPRGVDGACHVFVLNYGGVEPLRRHLPAILHAVRALGGRAQVSVVDNSTSGDAATWLAEHFPGCGLWKARNRGLASFTPAVRTVRSPLVVLCNNDIVPHVDAIRRLIDTLYAVPQAFAAGPRVLGLGDGTFEGCSARLLWRRGLVRTVLEDRSRGPCVTVSTGVVMAVWRRKYLELGGFAEAYFPGRYEDLELCVRAAARGWPTLYEPRAVVWHQGSMTFRQNYQEAVLQFLDRRNAHLFALRNYSGLRLRVAYWLAAGARIAAGLLRGDLSELRAWWQAWQRARSYPSNARPLDDTLLQRLQSLPRDLFDRRAEAA